MGRRRNKSRRNKPLWAQLNRWSKPILIALLCVLVLGATLFKVAKIKKNIHFTSSSPGSLFYSETAFHYRYAKIVAESKENPCRLISNDVFVQHPDTINAFKYYTIMMELLCGFAYRIFGFGLSFNLFLIYFNCFFSSLPLVMVFLIAKRLFQDDFLAFGASLFYFTTPISYVRTTGSPFIREDFTLVFLLLSVWLILILLDKRSRPFLSLFTGFVVVFSLSSWHFSHFVYICMLPFFFWIAVNKPRLLKNFFIPLSVMFIAGFIVPALKTRIFFASIIMCSLYAMLAGYFLYKPLKKTWLRAVVIFCIFVFLVGIRNILGLYEPAYSHVFGLFFSKLRFFLQKPDNPLLLSFNARQLWEGAFNSPTLGELWGLGRLAFPLGIMGALWMLWSQRQKSRPAVLVASLALILFMLSIMVKRILVVSAPFVSIALCGCLIDYDRKKYLVRGGLTLLLVLNFMGMSLRPAHAAYFQPANFNSLFEWVNSNTRPGDAFVARVPMSPMILLNTGRPQVIHPKFENLAIREKYKEFVTALYGTDEKDLFRFCKENKAEYLIYDRSFFISDDKNSLRYLGAQVPNISGETVAARLHFCGPDLKYFRPQYRNNAFVVFRVVGKEEDAAVRKLAYSPVYDPALFVKEEGFYKDTRKSYNNILSYVTTVNQSSDLLLSNQASLVVNMLRPMVQRIPRGSHGVYLLAQAHIRLDQYQEAEAVLDKYLSPMSMEDIAIEPLGPQILESMADVLYSRDLFDKSHAILNKCLKLPSHSAEVYMKLGILSQKRGDSKQAERYFRQYNKRQKNSK